MVIMFGGLHLEMSMWNMLGDYLAGCGWTVALCEVGIASSGVADGLLNASHLTKTRHAHQNHCSIVPIAERNICLIR